MSSRFVSGGAIDAATGDAVDLSKVAKVADKAETTTSPPTARQAEWAAVEKELEADRQRRAEARKALGNGSAAEKSLYDILQANKAAKQAAFEEAHKLKNQFRALDEDEIDFLEGVEADARAAEARVRAETQARLDEFRAAQTGGGVGARGPDDDGDGDDSLEHTVGAEGDASWAATGRKRKRRADKAAAAFPNLKRKGSAPSADKANNEEKEVKEKIGKGSSPTLAASKAKGKAQPPPPANAPKAKPILGLVDYGSDDDDNDDSD